MAVGDIPGPMSVRPPHTHRRETMPISRSFQMRCLALAITLLASPLSASAAVSSDAATGPTAESALAADETLATAMSKNDIPGIENMLDDDWIVVATSGAIAEGKNVFPDGIKSGHLIRKSFELIDPRVRLYGNTALVTSKV